MKRRKYNLSNWKQGMSNETLIAKAKEYLVEVQRRADHFEEDTAKICCPFVEGTDIPVGMVESINP